MNFTFDKEKKILLVWKLKKTNKPHNNTSNDVVRREISWFFMFTTVY